jgi:phage-related protein
MAALLAFEAALLTATAPTFQETNQVLHEYARLGIVWILSLYVKRPAYFIGSSKSDLRVFPKAVRHVVGHAIYMAQNGAKHPDTKPLKGFGSAGVLEVIDDFDGNTYRTVYTVRFEQALYVLHAFQKKSKTGIATAKSDLDLIKLRLRQAEKDYELIMGK